MASAFRVVAIVSAFNESDIISYTIQHLIENGIDVYLLDDGSTDDTVAEARKWLSRGLIDIETMPRSQHQDGTASPFEWGRILARKEQLAQTLPADWFVHHDADEIRESPWPGVNLREAIRWVDALGYNCIDFRVLNFPPIDDGFTRGDDPRTYFRFCEEGADFDSIQLKCWKRTPHPSLQPFGGHEVQFDGRRVFPIRFLLRHYPIRGQTHGRKKVFEWRKGRFLKAETERGWHLQYDAFADAGHDFLKDPGTLRPFGLDEIRLEQMLPDKDLRHLAKRVMREDEALDRLHGELAEWQRHAAILEQDRASLQQHAAVLERDRASLQQHAANLAADRESLQKHAANLEHELQGLRQHVANLEAAAAERRHGGEPVANEPDADGRDG